MDPNKKTHHNTVTTQTGDIRVQIAELKEEIAKLQKDGSPPKLDEAEMLSLEIEQLKEAANEKEEQ